MNAASEKRKELADQDANALVSAEQGEIAINDEYRKRLVLQAQINQLKIDGLKAEAAALQTNRDTLIEDYNNILKDIQVQGKVATPEGFTAEQIAVVKQLESFGQSNSLTQAFDAATSLAGKSFDDLQKLFLEGRLDDRAKE